jgi:hypothetical protein
MNRAKKQGAAPGFVRMSGRPLDAFRVLPVVLLRHLSKELGIPVPDVASLRALYSRGRTLSDHQELAWRWLGFSWMTPHQRGALVRVLRDEVVGCADREQLLAHARRWLHEHRLLIVHDRALRTLVASASRELEAETAATIRTTPVPQGRACVARRLSCSRRSWVPSAPPRRSGASWSASKARAHHEPALGSIGMPSHNERQLLGGSVWDTKAVAPLLASTWKSQVAPQQIAAVTDHSMRPVSALKPSQPLNATVGSSTSSGAAARAEQFAASCDRKDPTSQSIGAPQRRAFGNHVVWRPHR